nr:MAG TPA: hypothetical protein [Caudoviricetes sp.]
MADCRIIANFEEHFVHVHPLFVHLSGKFTLSFRPP